MIVRVIVPPDPIVAPSDLSGGGDVEGLIQAVTEEIDGPSGWLGRSLGLQTLEASVCDWSDLRLPFGPIIEVEGVSYIDENGDEQTVDGGDFTEAHGIVRFRDDWDEPRLGDTKYPVTVRYRAGYDGDTTGPIPERARQAIILSAQHLASLSVPSLYLKTDEVEGIGRKEYTLSDQATKVVTNVCERLLSTLRVFA